jgi:nitrogen fixation protein FixH
VTVRWHWGHSIAAVYTAFALCTLGFVVFAMEQRVDLVSTDYYAQSIALDARRAAEANARALGSALAVTPATDGRLVTIQWPQAATLGATGTVTLYRPADATADRRIAMAPDASGTQIVTLAGLAPGRWTVQVSWTVGGRAFYTEREVVAR